jgi:hypothetical protein
MGLPLIDVRFTPKSGHCRTTLGCPLCAKSGHHSQFTRDYIVSSTCVSPSGKNSMVAIKIATPHRELQSCATETPVVKAQQI